MDTRTPSYTTRMIALEGGRWPVARQLPHRWKLRRLAIGWVLELRCGVGRNLHLADVFSAAEAGRWFRGNEFVTGGRKP